MSLNPQPSTLNPSAEHALLLHCARTRVDAERAGQIRALASAGLDWDYLVETAQRHAVLPLLCQNLSAVCPDAVPAEALAELKKRNLANTQRSLFLTGEMFRLVEQLEAAGVKAMPFKGPVLASVYYGNPALRAFCDIDLLVEAERVTHASGVLSKAGYQDVDNLTPGQLQCCARYANSLNFAHRTSGIAVDLHWVMWPDWFSARRSAAFFRAGVRRLSVCGRDVLANSPEATLLMLCLHGAKHAWSGLGSVCDVHELVCSTPALDWRSLLDQARRLRAERLLLLGLALAQRLLGASLPACVQQELNSEPVVSSMVAEIGDRIFSGPTAPEAALIPGVLLRTRRGLARKLACTLRFAFRPSLTDICSVRLPRLLFPLYHVVRPVRLMRKYGLRLLGRAGTGTACTGF